MNGLIIFSLPSTFLLPDLLMSNYSFSVMVTYQALAHVGHWNIQSAVARQACSDTICTLSASDAVTQDTPSGLHSIGIISHC